MARKIQHKRGLEANLPQLDVAEIAFTTDSKKPFIGSADGNVEIAKKADVDEKADKTYVDTELGKKASTDEVSAVSAQLADTSSNTAVQMANFESVNFITDINLNEAFAKNADSPIHVPTYVDGNDEVVHPSVLYFPNKWNGYHYWMAFTPFPNADPLEENPSIAVSDDGVNWRVPPGLTNPIESNPYDAVNSFHADANIVMDPDGKTMHLVWKYASGGSRILFVRSSTDGINWSPRVEIVNTASTELIDASPKVMTDGKKFIMWTVDTASKPTRLLMRTSDRIDGGWSEPQVCNMTFPTGRELWHMDICRVGSMYVMIAMEGNQGDHGSAALLKLAKSSDGVNWELSDLPVLPRIVGRWDENFYKSCILPAIINGKVGLRMWYGTAGNTSNDFLFAVTDITFDKSERIEKREVEVLKAVNSFDRTVFVDTFNRADGPVTNSTSGGLWVNNSGTGFKIVDGMATANTTGNMISTHNAGITDAEVSMEIHAEGQTSMLILRANPDVTPMTYVRFGANSGTYEALRFDGTTSTSLSRKLFPAKKGDVVRVKVQGDRYQCYVNEALVADFTESMNNTSTKFGMQAGNTSARIDNFIIKRV